MFSKDPLKPAILFHFRDRYSSAMFQGIILDIEVAGVLTVGENQFFALKRKLSAVTLDITTAGHYRIRFGDNPKSVSLDTVNVNTLFDIVHF